MSYFLENSKITAANLSTIQVYDQYLSKISNYCLSAQEFEELYQNKSRFGLVFLFATYLMEETYNQIGLNELRRHFHLRPRGILKNENEELENSDVSSTIDDDTQKGLAHFQTKIRWFIDKSPFEERFRQEEIDNAERVLDRKFPEIRKLFVLVFFGKETKLSPSNIDRLFSEFFRTRSQLNNNVHIMILNSIDGINLKKTKTKCS